MRKKQGCLGCVALIVTLLPACEASQDASSNTAVAAASLVSQASAGKKKAMPRATPPSPSGTRLRSIYFRGDDGSRMHHGFFDAERKEECSFEYFSGGDGEPHVYRCFPHAAGVRACDEGGDYFQDSACTVPLYEIYKGRFDDEPGKYYRVTESLSDQACGGDFLESGVYLVKPIKPKVLFRKQSFDNSCIEFSLGFEGKIFVELGERIPSENFVRAELAIDMP